MLPGSIVPLAQINVAPLQAPFSSSFAVFPLDTCLVRSSAAGLAAASAANERTAKRFIIKSEMRRNQISELESEKIDFWSFRFLGKRTAWYKRPSQGVRADGPREMPIKLKI
jgi:hypothetical protein